ncbi:uncharacterized protein LOC121709131 [Alosa sapidissima]|uniref:uncharacterized protein LOC121709131 n=1 Tax=Alosa sapidissima TaxID=34773 RepID=UPI001C09B612|nr:uncharacterized protein LOC121709131 [Alosa sapidissima]
MTANVTKFMKIVNGSNEHCCVPLCSASGRYNSSLSFHCFPKNVSLRAKWIHQVRRTGFTITQHTKVCSRHFKPHEIVTSKKGRRALVAGAVPSLFEWNNYSTKERPGVWERRARPPSPERVLEPAAAAEPIALPMVMDHDYEASPTVCVDRQHYEQLRQEIDTLREQLKICHLSKFGLQRFASSPEDIRFYTRFPSYKHLMAFWSLISTATSKMIRVTSRDKRATSTVTESPVTRPTKLLAIDELFLFLTYLSTGCTQRELAHRFNIHRTTVSRIIVTWANFLYTLLGSVCFWMSPAAVKDNLPPEFNAYSDTQVILDCTELRCQTPSSLVLQSEVFSHYKSHCTFKAMVGMSPHGALTFISPLFEGSMSDKEIFRQSGIQNLLTPDTAIMVDKGFLVDDLAPGTVYRPAFVIQRAQMAEADVLETQSIARLRVHVERLIRRVKENKLFETTIPLAISGSINQIFTVACLLSNFQNGPLVKTWANEV